MGYTYAKNGSVQQTVSTSYSTDGRIASAGFVHGGAVKQFGYAYLNGANLLQTLTMPNNMSLTQSFEEKRDLLTQMDYKRGNTLVSRRVYTYDTLARPLTRTTSRQGQTINDSFVHTYRSELASAQVNGETYGYYYDNIGNRRMAMEASDYAFYEANNLNQYTGIQRNEEEAFVPSFDTDGNQTLVRTATGIWSVTYNAENRPVIFQKITDSMTTRITCSYDSMGRRATKKVEEITTDAEGNESANVISHHRFIYREYLQIACCDLTRTAHPCLWLITWDPTQPVATRPLAIQKDGTWYCYGWDLTKNICEVFGQNGYIRTAYTYTPYGSVTANGDITQPIQWSSEYADSDLALVYYNYRHYNSMDGRWLGRDKVNTLNRYAYNASPFYHFDGLGLFIFSNIDLDKVEDIIRYEAKKVGRLLDQALTEAKNIGKAIDRKTSPYVCKGKRIVKPHVKRLSDFGKPYVIGAFNMVKPYVDEAIQLVDTASAFADPYLQQMMGYWNYFKATEFAQSWNWATTHFYNWILGNLPPDSTYHADKHIEARYVRDGIVGQELRNYFYKIRNQNSKYCHEWKSVDNYDVSFLGFDTFEGLSISKIKKHFSRTIRSFSNGLEFYLGSVQDGTAIVSPIKKENGSHYVEVEFKYINKTTSESFLYHIIEGEKKRGVMKTWTQTYIWTEKIPCSCK